MSTLSYSVTLTNGTTADVNQVETKFNEAKNIINGNIDSTNMNMTLDYTFTGILTSSYLAAKYNGSVFNLGLSNASNQLKLVQASGSTLSTTTPGWVVVPSTTIGRHVLLKVSTNNILFDYNGAADSDIIGEEFGTTAGVAWGNARPFMLYAVNTTDADGGLYFAISPDPTLTKTPASSNNIGYLDTVASTPSDSNMFFLTSTNVTAQTGKPCVAIGSFRMTKNSSDDWTVVTLDEGDGISNFYNFQGRYYTMPSGQMGATSGKYMQDNGGTAPVFTTNNYNYSLSRDGYVTANIYLDADGGTDGATAVNARVAIPYLAPNNGQSTINPGYINSVGTGEQIVGYVIDPNTSYFLMVRNATASTVSTVLNSNLSAGARRINGSIRYKAFGS